MASWTQTMSRDSRYYITLTVNEVIPSDYITTNQTYCTYSLTATKTDGTGYYSNDAKNPAVCKVDGNTDSGNKTYDFRGSTPKTITLLSGTSPRITHNADGTKTITVEGSFEDKANSLGSASISKSFTLTAIPRSFTQTPKVEVQSSTNTSITFKWTTSENCGAIKYILDGGGETSVWTGTATSGTFTINNLSAKTSHTMKINAQRKDSGMWSYSGQISASTTNKTVRVKVNGAWKDATPYVRVNGQWKEAVPYTRVSGQWKKGK